MSDRAQLTDELTTAGFDEVSIVDHVAPFRFDSVDEYVEFNKANLPPPILDRATEEAWGAVADAMQRYVDTDGSLRLPSTALCVRAVKPIR